MNVSWLEQSAFDVPEENDWLAPGELLRLDAMRFVKRRSDWRLGRWTAKLAVAAYFRYEFCQDQLARIEIRSAPCGAPEIYLEGKPAELRISISHRAGLSVCAIAHPGLDLGCDLEVVEARSEAFIADYFTREEQGLLAKTQPDYRSFVASLLWSCKESALKALHEGLRLDTRSVTVFPDESGWLVDREGNRFPRNSNFHSDDSCALEWHPMQIRDAHGKRFHGFWRYKGQFLRTIVGSSPFSQPIQLGLSRNNSGVVEREAASAA